MTGQSRGRDRLVRAAGTALTAVTVLLLTVFVASHLTRSSDRQALTYDGEFTTVEVSVTGTALVTATAASSVRAEWDLSWSLFRPQVEESTDGDTLRLSVSCNDGPGRDCSSAVALYVPARVAVVVNAPDGVWANGVRGGVRAVSEDGPVTVKDVAGPVHLETRDGSVSASELASREVRADTRDGAVSLSLTAPPQSVRVGTRDARTDLVLPSARGGYALDIDRQDGSQHVDVPVNPRSERQVTIRSRNADVRVEAAVPGR